jgi:hypothetical protein
MLWKYRSPLLLFNFVRSHSPTTSVTIAGIEIKALYSLARCHMELYQNISLFYAVWLVFSALPRFAVASPSYYPVEGLGHDFHLAE